MDETSVQRESRFVAASVSGRCRGTVHQRVGKRAMDVVAAVGGIVLLSPVLVAAAVAVKISSPGPILFRQARVGRNGRMFSIAKFRTMYHGSVGSGLTAAGDRRVTSVGRVLRRYKLDELPQLWNVLVGDMSIVGPRPELPRYVEKFPEAYARILSVRPGITDYASLQYRDEESVLAGAADPGALYVESVLPAKLELSRRYIEEMSFVTDLKLVLRTISAVWS